MRSFASIFVVLSLFFACLSFAIVTARGADDVPEGSECGNGDTCSLGNICYVNVCRPSADTSGELNGFGNACSADDCCNNGLACNALAARCVPADTPLPLIQCGSGETTLPNSTTTPYYPNIPAIEGINLGPGSDEELGGRKDVVTDCKNRDVCVGGYMCISTQCVPIPADNNDSVVPGLGNPCTETDCCRVGLKCTSFGGNETQICVLIATPNVPALACSISVSPNDPVGSTGGDGSIFDSTGGDDGSSSGLTGSDSGSGSTGSIIPPIVGSTGGVVVNPDNSAAGFGVSYTIVGMTCLASILIGMMPW